MAHEVAVDPVSGIDAVLERLHVVVGELAGRRGLDVTVRIRVAVGVLAAGDELRDQAHRRRGACADREFRVRDAAEADAEHFAQDHRQIENTVLEQFKRNQHGRRREFVGVPVHFRELGIDRRADRCRLAKLNAGVAGVVRGRPGQPLAAVGAERFGNLAHAPVIEHVDFEFADQRFGRNQIAAARAGAGRQRGAILGRVGLAQRFAQLRAMHGAGIGREFVGVRCAEQRHRELLGVRIEPDRPAGVEVLFGDELAHLVREPGTQGAGAQFVGVVAGDVGIAIAPRGVAAAGQPGDFGDAVLFGFDRVGSLGDRQGAGNFRAPHIGVVITVERDP